VTRTQDEILSRYHAADDFLGFAIEVLAEAMTADTIRSINPGAELPEDWAPRTAEAIETAAREYLTFALGKIVDHRGISASRSVIKLTEYAWLLGRDDVVAAIDEADYAQYGAPQVKAFAAGMGWPFAETVEDPADREVLERMALGRFCEDDCMAGCGQ
jgi:hypothetical protein